MPFLGKSGTSRMSCFRWSQFALCFTDWASAITMLLQFEIWLSLKSAWLRALPHRPHVLHGDPAASATAGRKADRGYPSPALPRCRRNCCAPSRRCPACELPAPQTSESLPLAHDRERRTVGLESDHRV